MRRLFPFCWAVALTSANAWAADSAPQQQAQLGVGSSPVVAGGGAGYAKDAFVFADFDGDGEEELLTQTETYEHPRRTAATVLPWDPAEGGVWLDVLGGSAGTLDAPGHADVAVMFADRDADGEEEVVATEKVTRERQATISRWLDDGRTVGWRSGTFPHRMLVGNLTGDATPELVLFCGMQGVCGASFERGPSRPQERSPTRIVQWDGSRHAIRKFDSSGRLGALADFDGDGVSELVFATPMLAHPRPIDPVELRAYAFTGEALQPTRDLRLEHGVAAIAAADLDGDGGDELVTVEISRWDNVTGLLGVYEASETGFHPLFRKNRVLADINLLTVFESGGKPYIYAERGALRWRTVLRLAPDGEGSFALETVGGAERLSLLEDALKATAADSALTSFAVWAKSSQPLVDANGRITDRPAGAYLGKRGLSAKGDFDGDGRPDEAFFLAGDKTTASPGFRGDRIMVSLVVSFGAETKEDAVIWEAAADNDMLRRVGAETVGPGTYTPLCMRTGDPCEEGEEEEELVLKHDGIRYFYFQATASLYYLPEGEDGEFKRLQLAD